MQSVDVYLSRRSKMSEIYDEYGLIKDKIPNLTLIEKDNEFQVFIDGEEVIVEGNCVVMYESPEAIEKRSKNVDQYDPSSSGGYISSAKPVPWASGSTSGTEISSNLSGTSEYEITTGMPSITFEGDIDLNEEQLEKLSDDIDKIKKSRFWNRK
jgi:hypothetical protein